LFLSDHLPRSNYEKLSVSNVKIKPLKNSNTDSLPKLNVHHSLDIEDSRPKKEKSNKEDGGKKKNHHVNDITNIKVISDVDKIQGSSQNKPALIIKNLLPDIHNKNEPSRNVRSPIKKEQKEKNNLDHLNQIYQIYVPYLKNQLQGKYNKYLPNEKNNIKNIERYYDNQHIKKVDMNKKALVRKLSPLKNLR